MLRFTQLILVFTLSSGVLTLVTAQEDQNFQNKEQEKSKNTVQEQIQLQDRNQNRGTLQNREENKVIHRAHFVDHDGDGFHDYAPDHDKDGIPNGQDADYQGTGKGQRKAAFRDADGDGIDDNMSETQRQVQKRNRKAGYGPRDGTGYQGQGPKDGSGYGPGTNCNGSGPKGRKGSRQG